MSSDKAKPKRAGKQGMLLVLHEEVIGIRMMGNCSMPVSKEKTSKIKISNLSPLIALEVPTT